MIALFFSLSMSLYTHTHTHACSKRQRQAVAEQWRKRSDLFSCFCFPSFGKLAASDGGVTAIASITTSLSLLYFLQQYYISCNRPKSAIPDLDCLILISFHWANSGLRMATSDPGSDWNWPIWRNLFKIIVLNILNSEHESESTFDFSHIQKTIS